MTEVRLKNVIVRSAICKIDTYTGYEVEDVVGWFKNLEDHILSEVPSGCVVVEKPKLEFSVSGDYVNAQALLIYKESQVEAEKRLKREAARAKKTAKKTQTLEETRKSKEFRAFRKQFAEYRKLGIGIGEM
jgi:hypothetical protein